MSPSIHLSHQQQILEEGNGSNHVGVAGVPSLPPPLSLSAMHPGWSGFCRWQSCRALSSTPLPYPSSSLSTNQPHKRPERPLECVTHVPLRLPATWSRPHAGHTALSPARLLRCGKGRRARGWSDRACKGAASLLATTTQGVLACLSSMQSSTSLCCSICEQPARYCLKAPRGTRLFAQMVAAGLLDLSQISWIDARSIFHLLEIFVGSLFTWVYLLNLSAIQQRFSLPTNQRTKCVTSWIMLSSRIFVYIYN